jgi:hypothetical protein
VAVAVCLFLDRCTFTAIDLLNASGRYRNTLGVMCLEHAPVNLGTLPGWCRSHVSARLTETGAAPVVPRGVLTPKIVHHRHPTPASTGQPFRSGHDAPACAD